MKRIINLFLLSAFVSLSVGCSIKEFDSDEETPQVSTVSLMIGKDASKTKAEESFTTAKRTVVADLSDESGIEGLVIEETDTILDEMPAVTKGTPVYTENFAYLYASSGFNASAVYDYSTKDPLEDLAPAKFTKNEGNDMWSHDYGSGVDLPKKALFYFNAPATLPAYIETPSYDADDESVTFNLVPAEYPKTATAQTDVLFSAEGIELSKVETITFYHAFASVKFKISNPDGPFQITKVEMTNMLTSGTCTITPSDDDGDDPSSVARWTTPDDSSSYDTFSQEYNGVVTYDPDDEYFAESFYSDETYKNNLSLASDKKATTTFNCVPQAFSKNDEKPVTVTITYTKGDETKTAVVDFSTILDGKEWKAGHLYTYSLNITELSVSVEDSASGDTKSDVVITNTGNTAGFIRASIVANWVKDIEGDEAVIRSCDPLTEGNTKVEIGENWISGGDGYYYYKFGVNGGEATKENLFDTYTAAAAPITGASLQMSILAQIVKDRAVWGSSVPTGVSNDIEK